MVGQLRPEAFWFKPFDKDPWCKTNKRISQKVYSFKFALDYINTFDATISPAILMLFIMAYSKRPLVK